MTVGRALLIAPLVAAIVANIYVIGYCIAVGQARLIAPNIAAICACVSVGLLLLVVWR